MFLFSISILLSTIDNVDTCNNNQPKNLWYYIRNNKMNGNADKIRRKRPHYVIIVATHSICQKSRKSPFQPIVV